MNMHQHWALRTPSWRGAHLAMVDVTNGACSSQLQLFVNDEANAVPILTWGFDRSKIVASPRIPFASLPSTCSTGLTPLCCRTASRLVRSMGANERVMTTILTHLALKPEHDNEGMG